MPKGLDVLHVMWQGGVGGAERALFQLAHHQHLDGRRRVGIAYGQARGEWFEAGVGAGIPTVDLRMRSIGDLTAVARSLKHFHGARIHHFHCVEPTLMWASCLTPGRARVYTHRAGATSYSGKRALRYRSMAPLMRRRFAVTGNTTHATNAARTLFGLTGEVPTTHNGMDLSLLDSSVNRHDRRRDQLVGEETIVIGTAANLRNWKRIDWLIDAAASLPDSGWCMWILGEGPARNHLEHLARASNAANRIRFLGSQSHIGAWLRAMDIFALPSGPEESFGNAAVEAMACGLPTIVAADSPGMVEHVEHDVTGLVVTDPVDLGQQLNRLMNHPALRRRLGSAAETSVARRYTMERAVERYEAVYRQLTR